MFARVNTLCLPLVFALCASAASVSVRTYGGEGPTVNCNANTGTQQCCNSVTKSTDPSVSGLLGLLGITLSDLTGDIGLTCVPIVGNAGCNAQAVCCTGNNFGGLVSIGCSPISIGL